MMKRKVFLLGTLLLSIVTGLSAFATAARAENWDSLMEVTPKFSWYPQAEVLKLIEMKSQAYGQTLEEYRAGLLSAVTGGEPPTGTVNTDDFVTGRPWRDYFHLALAEFSLYLASGKERQLDNAREALSFLEEKQGNHEIDFWRHLFEAHRAGLDASRQGFIDSTYTLWQEVILRVEVEALKLPESARIAGFAGNLPHLYENLAHLILRVGILENEIPRLHPLSALILDLETKLSVENGYRTMVEQVVKRMEGTHSDNRNLNFAVALIEATAKRYDFEDENDPGLLADRYNQTRKYYQLAADWADTPKGKAAVQMEYAGFLNYTVTRLGDPSDPVAGNPFFAAIPSLANNHLEHAFSFFEQLASGEIRQQEGRAAGYASEENYLRGLHQLWDANAKLAIAVSSHFRSRLSPEKGGDIMTAARPLERYCSLFDRFARSNADVLPDNAYFLTAYAARQLGDIYRERARYSIDSRADRLAFAYQLQAAEIFPLDLPAILHMAYECSDNGQIQQYYHYSSPLAARLRVSNGVAVWMKQNSTDFDHMISLVPTVVPQVVDNAFVLLGQLPGEEMAEDDLFARTVEASLALGGSGGPGSGASGEEAYPFFALKNQLYGAPDSPLHDFLRTLYNEVPYENHQYVALMKELR